ncbi:MAG TPA: FHA domain-containing protein [Candidatus Methylomirabilis sp.]|nr:FHA domain-containing protein [Candidatus Methylomirabilis sp.]
MPSSGESRVVLVALTPEAKAALGGAEARISIFPFRIGRDSRSLRRTAPRTLVDRRKRAARPTNELYLPEAAEPFQVSRDHLQIQHNGTRYVLIDRQSAFGTIVEGTVIGGQQRGGAVQLNDGDVIIVGSSRSPFVLKFCLR